MTKQGPDFAEDIARLHERGELERLRAALAKSEAEIERLTDALVRAGSAFVMSQRALQAADALAMVVEHDGGASGATVEAMEAFRECRAKVPA